MVCRQARRGGKVRGGAAKERCQFSRDLRADAGFANTHLCFAVFLQSCNLGPERFALDELQKVQMCAAADRDHVADGCGDPVGQQGGLFGKASGGPTQQFGKGGTEGAGAVETRVKLGINDPRPLRNADKAFSQPALPRHFQKGHAKVAFETTADSGQVKTHGFDIPFGPAVIWAIFKRCKKRGDGGIFLCHGGQGFTSFAGAIASVDAFANTSEKAAVFGFGFSGRAGQSAEDPGGGHTDIGAAIIGRVAIQQSLIKRVMRGQIKQHSVTIGIWIGTAA